MKRKRKASKGGDNSNIKVWELNPGTEIKAIGICLNELKEEVSSILE